MPEPKYTFFYGGPFSQHYMRSFEVEYVDFCTKRYNCCEQYMMSEKAYLFGDIETAHKIMAATNPHKQKELGRGVKNFDKKIWDENRESIVFRGNFAKYDQNEDLRKILFATTGTTLVEASPSDKIWGIGLSMDNPNRFDITKWRGLNLLGKVETDVREALMEKYK